MDLFKDAAAFLDALERQGVTYMVVGGVALDAYSVGRTTLGLDVQVALGALSPAHSPTAFGAIVEERTRDTVFGQDVIILHPATSPLWIEVFVTTHWFTRQALDRRPHVRSGLLGRDVPVPRREDLILLKAAYSQAPQRREAKRAQALLDVDALLEGHPDLDIPYVKENAGRLGVDDVVMPRLR